MSQTIPPSESPYRDVSVTAQMAQEAPHRACPICGTRPESPRATFCSQRCRMVAFRRRHGHQQLARELTAPSLSRPSREHVVYECPGCETRFLGEQRCFLCRIRHKKDDRGLRTETTFNDTYDFRIGRSLKNLPQLVQLCRDINQRLLLMERESQHCTPAASVFEQLVMPTGEPGRRAPGLRFGDPRTVALFGALSQFQSIFGGFYAKELRPRVEHHLARPYAMNQMAYDLSRLIKKGLLERLPASNRYRLTELGRKLTLFVTQLYNRVFSRGLAQLHPDFPDTKLNAAWNKFNGQLQALLLDARLAA